MVLRELKLMPFSWYFFHLVCSVKPKMMMNKTEKEVTMKDDVLENMLEVQNRHLKIAESIGESIRKYLENKTEKDLFLDKDAVAEITGLGTDTAIQIIQKINKKIKKTKPDAVHNGRVLASNFYKFYAMEE